MKETLAAMQNIGLDVPAAFRGLYTSEQITDWVRFGQVENVIGALDIQDGPLKACVDQGEAETFLVDSISDVVKGFVTNITFPISSSDMDDVNFLKEICGRLGESCLQHVARADMVILGAALGYDEASREQRQAAVKHMAELMQNSGYDGILKCLFAEAKWLSAIDWMKKQSEKDGQQANNTTMTHLKLCFDNLSQDTGDTQGTRDDFDKAFIDAMEVAIGPECEKKLLAECSVVLAGMAEVSKSSLVSWEARLRDICNAAKQVGDASMTAAVVDSLRELERSGVALSRKSAFDVEKVLDELSATTECLPTALCERAASVVKFSSKVKKWQSLVNAFIRVSSTLVLLEMTDAETKGEHMKQLAEDVAQAKDLFSQQEGVGEATHQAWQELQATCDCCELGKDIYVDKIGKFKQAAVDVVMLAGSITTPVTNDQLKDILVAVEALCQHLSLGGPRAQCLAVHNMPFLFLLRGSSQHGADHDAGLLMVVKSEV
jgi:hypothetical protein